MEEQKILFPECPAHPEAGVARESIIFLDKTYYNWVCPICRRELKTPKGEVDEE